MPRCSSQAHLRSSCRMDELEPGSRAAPTSDMLHFWESLPLGRRKELLSVNRKSLFMRIRQQFCSRCFGLFVLRYEEMKGTAALDCPACQEFYAGLSVSSTGEIAVEKTILETEPFTLFAEGKLREREREMSFMTGDICGSGFQKRPGVNMCALHSSTVPAEALLEYFKELPEEHKTALLTLREEDFAAELDAHLKYQLRICRDCRCNVMRAYRDLKPAARGQPAEGPQLELCSDFIMKVAERLVTVDGEGVAEFLNRAEDVEGCKTLDGECEYYYDDPDHVRHAETPELAREALVDSAVLIFKSQIEVAFREQTAGHNALLLFVGLALQLMEEQLHNAFKELGAKEAEAELLDLVAKEKEKKAPKSKKKGKKAVKPADKESTENSMAKPYQGCRECTSLQKCTRCRQSGNPSLASTVPLTPLRHRLPGSSPARHPGHSPKEEFRPLDGEAFGWEVQQPKRRGATSQGLKRVVGSNSQSRSTSPDRLRRSSIDNGRSRSPFSHRASFVQPPEPPKRRQSTAPVAVPVSMFSSGVVKPPPPPPPPRETKPSNRIALPASQSAWQTKMQATQSSAQEWTPWTGRSPAQSYAEGPVWAGGVVPFPINVINSALTSTAPTCW